MSARVLLLASFLVGACGVPQEIFDVRMRELDRCKTDLTRTQSDYNATQKNADELATESSELRDKISTLETDRTKMSSSLSSQKQHIELFKNAFQLADRRADLYLLIAAKLKPLVEAKQIILDAGKSRMLVRFPDTLVFDAGRADVRTEGQAVLREVAAVMKQINRDILVAVHNDNQPLPKGTAFKSGWELTTARAVAIVRFFQGEGVDPRHLGAAGYSEFNFLADNVEESGRGMNRRVELVIMPGADELLPLPPELGKRQAERTPVSLPAAPKP